MQPPSRKTKPSVHLKSVQAEQLSKLQQKHEQEYGLLEDIRFFSKQRASIEKEYAQAMCKLAQQCLSKRQFPAAPKVTQEDGKDYKAVMAVWKTVLEETERVGKARLQAADVYLQQIFDPVKPLRTAKAQSAKKVFEQTQVLQKEVALTIQELTKAQKIYCDEEHLTHEARVKASDADNKVKNKSTGLFTSMATLQQKSAKLNLRRDQCEVKSTSARNEYLLALASANAHQNRYFNVDMPELLRILDGELYERVHEFFISLSRTELECCGLTQECFSKVMSDAALISRQYNLECFLAENGCFTGSLQYQYEPQDSDQTTLVCNDHGATEALEAEARRSALQVAQSDRQIREATRQLQHLSDQQQNPAPLSPGPTSNGSEGRKSSSTAPNDNHVGGDLELRIEDARQNMRRAETTKLKAEARLAVLQAGGVNIDGYLEAAIRETEAQAKEDERLAMEQRAEQLKRRASEQNKSDHAKQVEQSKAEKAEQTKAAEQKQERSSVSKESNRLSSSASRTESRSSHHQSQGEDEERGMSSPPQVSPPSNSSYIKYADAEEEYVDEAFEAPAAISTATGRVFPMKCTALYDFEASNTDELTIGQGQDLELVADGDGDGWVRAKDASGVVGLVPENYVQTVEDANEMSVDQEIPECAPPLPVSHSQTQATPAIATAHPTDLAIKAQDEVVGQIERVVSPEQVLLAEMPGNEAAECWVRALYDYDAVNAEELMFAEGQFIRVLRKDVHGVDDGWWYGELEGKTGVFPSLMVEELSQEDALPLESPMRPGPPAFTPLEPPPPVLEVTHPTPSDEELPSPQRISGYHVIRWNQESTV